MATAEPRQIEWSSAQIEEGMLTVRLTGSASKAWKARFENVLTLLDTPHSSWGEVRLTKNAIKVAEVQPGTETELRHFLESIALQANSELSPPEQGARDAKEAQVDEVVQADRQMTAAFRAFADG